MLSDAGYVVFNDTEQQVAMIGLSDKTMCAVTTTGDLYCWGDDYYGEVADQHTSNDTYFARKVATGIATVAPQDNGGCALGTDHGLRCWGANYTALLTDGGSLLSVPTTPQMTNIVALSNGYDPGSGDDITCVVTSTGQAYCWGSVNGGYDEIAPGAPAGVQGRSPSLVALGDAGAVGSSSITNVFVGGDNTCALVTGGIPICWGANSYGQLGDNGIGGIIDITCIPKAVPDAGVNDLPDPGLRGS